MKKTVIKIVCMVILFVCIIGGYAGYKYFTRDEGKNQESTMPMGSASLPIVHTKLGNYSINELHGYTMEMNMAYMREAVTVLTSNKTLEIEIDKYDTLITDISYVITTLEGEIVEEYKFVAWELEETKAVAIAPCTGDIVQGEEYILDIKISTEKDKDIHYYSILKYDPEMDFASQLDFVKEFSNKTFDYEQAKDLIPYIEPSSENANDNLGNVDITSSFNQLTWAGLDVKKLSEPVITITDVSSPAICYKLTYQVEAPNEYDHIEKYNVSEYFRVCTYKERIFLISYNRQMNQLYDVKTGNVSLKRMNVGIDSDLNIEYMASDSTKYIAFVKERQLWLMDINSNEMTLAFSFFDDINNGLRERYANNNIKIIDVDDDGNMWFLVYGYMNRGEHEGKSGVTLYKYNEDENLVEEVTYLPSDKPYQILKEYIGELCYITEDTMYIYIDGSVYAVDLNLKEYVEVVGELNSDNFAVNLSGNTIAWIDDSNGTSDIRIKNLDGGDDLTIKGEEGIVQVPLGFMGADFVYGVAKESNIIKDSNGDKMILMSQIKITDDKANELKTYKKKGKLIAGVEIQDTMIHFSVGKKSGKIFEVTGEDQIFNNAEPTEEAVTQTKIVTEKKQTELVINYANNVISSETTKLVMPKEINTASANALSIKPKESKDFNYYVYGLGEMLGIYASEKMAAAVAEDVKGFVVDSTNGKVWKCIEEFKN